MLSMQMAPPGTVMDDKLIISCGVSGLKLEILQRAGKNPMTAAEFSRGFDLSIGTKSKLMQRYKLTLEYNGSGFVGWQRQINGLGIQEVIEEAIKRFCGEISHSFWIWKDRCWCPCNVSGGSL